MLLVVLNLPLIGLWVKMISVPSPLPVSGNHRVLRHRRLLTNTTFDVYFMAVFGLLGYVFRKLGCEPAPMMLGFILGQMMEEFLRRALLLSKGDPTVFSVARSAPPCWSSRCLP